MSRVYNFSAGPSVLPEDVLKKAAAQMMEYESSGMSVMEMSHRSADYEAIIGKAESLLRELMHIPDNYKVMFLQGGASTQFAMIPLNLLKNSKKADYVITGQWAKKAASEAEKYGEVKKVASSADKTFSYIPKLDKNEFTPDADYFHITVNNTIYGTRYTELPDTGNVPLVGDISSNILSEPIDVTKFGLLYAGAQKNMGPAGLTVVIAREDLITDVPDFVPTMLQYKVHAENGSMYKEAVKELKKIPEIVECHFTTGNYTMLTKLYCRDNEHLMELLNAKIQEIPGVTATETLISLEKSIKKEIPICKN